MARSTLSVWTFDTLAGADDATRLLEQLQSEDPVTVLDHAVVSWAADNPTPTTRLGTSPAVHGALGEAFWGLLLGLIFFVPLLGAAVGTTSAVETGPLRDVGIDDELVDRVRAQVTPGRSALFVVTSDVVLDQVKHAFMVQGPSELILTTLSAEQENVLRQVFAQG